MKKLLNYFPLVLLLFSLIFNSCSDQREELENEAALSYEKREISHLNTKENRVAILKAIPTIKEAYNADYDLANADFDRLISEYEHCSECPSDYKKLMVPFLKDIVNTDDNQLLEIIKKYQSSIKQYTSNFEVEQNLEFLFFSFQESVKFQQSKSIYQKGAGKNIGRGMAWGFLAGCATGAYIGGTAGTVTVPIIGTVVGAVSGCIAGGAWGAVTGSAGGAFWSLFD